MFRTKTIFREGPCTFLQEEAKFEVMPLAAGKQFSKQNKSHSRYQTWLLLNKKKKVRD